MQKRKLQVFVSSTYKDLISERQAAVEAILSAGHIPAGMELFAAGDKSQWQVIKEWIEESDVYLLILGGRYGSIEKESGKSYTQLEYEYALSRGKPLFSVVIQQEHLNRKVKKHGTSVVELENPPQFQEFKKLVESKIVRYWGDVKDIKLAIHETLNQYGKREELIGWIPGNQGVNGTELAEEIARLSKENDGLRRKVAELEVENALKVQGMPIEEYIRFLETQKLEKTDLDTLGNKKRQLLKSLAGEDELNLLHIFQAVAGKIDGVTPIIVSPDIKKLSLFGLITLKNSKQSSNPTPEFTENGRTVFIFLKNQNKIPFTIEDPVKSSMPKFVS